ncbi:unnamed protein product [Cunninghamella echinulata]
MTSKATQEYRSSFITLISQLSEIESKGNEFFDKIEKSANISYEPVTAQNDFEHLFSSLKSLENHAKTSGLLSLSGTAPGDSQPQQPIRNLSTRTSEAVESVNGFFQEKERLTKNVQAAINAINTSTYTGPSSST